MSDLQLSYDVAVIGGGTAGAAAAIAAARAGARTIVIEKNGMLGGTMTSACVNFPGLFFAWGERVIGGIPWELIERLCALDGAKLPPISYHNPKHWMEQIRIDPFLTAVLLDTLCAEAGVVVLFHTMLAEASETSAGLCLRLTCKEGTLTLHVKTAIDATGDANLVQRLGYACEKSPAQQPATLQNRIAGYDISQISETEVLSKTQAALRAGRLPDWFQPHSLYSWLEKGVIDLHVTSMDAGTSLGKSRAETAARMLVFDVLQLLRTVRGAERLRVSFFAPECGIRESVRIVGEETVTRADYLKGRRYADPVCHAFYPIDLHVPTGVEKTYLSEGVVPSIPFGALVPRGAVRLLATGRCIASDTNANSAIRVQAPCMAAGQAAGCAAALMTLHGMDAKTLSYPMLKELLLQQGAIVPESS